MSKNLCPFLKKTCIEHDCMLYTHVTMTDPQTGGSKDQFSCAVAWLPILLIDNANKTRGVQAAVESARHETTTRQDQFLDAVKLAGEARKQLTDG